MPKGRFDFSFLIVNFAFLLKNAPNLALLGFHANLFKFCFCLDLYLLNGFITFECYDLKFDLPIKTNRRVCIYMNNTTGATCEAGSSYPSGTPEIAPDFLWGSCCSILVDMLFHDLFIPTRIYFKEGGSL